MRYDDEEVKISIEADDNFEEKKSHPAIIHSLIEPKEELLRAVFFGDLPKVLTFLEENISDIKQVDIQSSLRLAIQQNDNCISLLLVLLQVEQEKRSPQTSPFSLLFACIFHKKPKLFAQLLTKIKVAEFSSLQVMQLYWLALYSKQDHFCTLLKSNGISPLPGVLRLAYFYKSSNEIMNYLWESLVDAEKMQFLHSILLTTDPTQTLESLHLPDQIQNWAKNPGNDWEVKSLPSDQLPVLSPSPYALTMEKINALVERQDYMSIIKNSAKNSDNLFQFMAKKLMEYALSNQAQKNHVEHVIEWLKCLYGSSNTAVKIFLNDSNLIKVPRALHFCLSLYYQECQYPLPLQSLTASFLENKALEMPVFRALRYLTTISDSQDLQGISSDDWNRKELLKGESVYINTLIQPLTCDKWGDLTQEIVNRLALPEELIFDDIDIPIPTTCLQIIMEYLIPEEQKALQIHYPVLKPSSILLKQIETLSHQLQENQDIIAELKSLLRFPATCRRWIKKHLGYIVAWPTSAGSIISVAFNVIYTAQHNDSIISTSSWQTCMNQGYQLTHSLFGFEICDKKTVPIPSIPECDVLCDELLNPPTGVTVWFVGSLIMILAPLFLYLFRYVASLSSSHNIIPGALNALIDQHYHRSHERAPVEIKNRSPLGVTLLINHLSDRQAGLQTRLDSLESKRQYSSEAPIQEEKEQVSPKTDIFRAKSKTTYSTEMTTPLLGSLNSTGL